MNRMYIESRMIGFYFLLENKSVKSPIIIWKKKDFLKMGQSIKENTHSKL